MRDKVKYQAVFWATAAAGLLLDLVSKHLVFAWMGHPARALPVIGRLLMVRTAKNTGTFFGIGSGGSGGNTALIVFTVLMTALVLYMFLVPPKETEGKRTLYSLALGLVFSGGLGNLYDRVVCGFVRDFVDIGIPGGKRWPTFNLADAWLVMGIIAYLVVLLGARRKPAPEPGEEGATP